MKKYMKHCMTKAIFKRLIPLEPFLIKDGLILDCHKVITKTVSFLYIHIMLFIKQRKIELQRKTFAI